MQGVCDSFTVLRKGRAVWSGTAAQLREHAPAVEYRLTTSDDVSALEIAARARRRAARRRRPRAACGCRRTPSSSTLRGWARDVAASRSAASRSRSGRSRRCSSRSPANPRGALTAQTRRTSVTDRRSDRRWPLAPTPRPRERIAPPSTAARVRSAFVVEWRKLIAQLATKVLALICVLGPFAFAAVLKLQSSTPSDTLFGVWVHSSGFAVSLVILGFAGQWGFPVIAGVVAGDILSSEDRYGTWKTVLTRSRTRGDLFAGKVLAASAVAVLIAGATAIASLVAGPGVHRRSVARRTRRAPDPVRSQPAAGARQLGRQPAAAARFRRARGAVLDRHPQRDPRRPRAGAGRAGDAAAGADRKRRLGAHAADRVRVRRLARAVGAARVRGRSDRRLSGQRRLARCVPGGGVVCLRPSRLRRRVRRTAVGVEDVGAGHARRTGADSGADGGDQPGADRGDAGAPDAARSRRPSTT